MANVITLLATNEKYNLHEFNILMLLLLLLQLLLYTLFQQSE